MSLTITLNGEPQTVSDGDSLQDLLDQLHLTGRRVAVEVNLEIVPRSQYAQYRLGEGDRVEVVHAIGGGSD